MAEVLQIAKCPYKFLEERHILDWCINIENHTGSPRHHPRNAGKSLKKHQRGYVRNMELKVGLPNNSFVAKSKYFIDFHPPTILFNAYNSR